MKFFKNSIIFSQSSRVFLIVLILLLVSLSLSSCYRKNPDMSQDLEVERQKLMQDFPRTDLEKISLERLRDVRIFQPDEDWQGPVVNWALQEYSVNKSPDLERINKYLSKSGAEYRLGLYVFITDMESQSIGIDYYEDLQAFLKSGEIDLINSGKATFNKTDKGSDDLAHKLLLENEQILEIEPKESYRQAFLRYEDKYVGLGIPHPRRRFGFFVRKDFCDDFGLNQLSDLNYQWIINNKDSLNSWSKKEKQAVLQLALDPRYLLTEYTVPNSDNTLLFVNKDGEVGIFWDAPSFKIIEKMCKSLDTNAVLREEEAKGTPLKLCFEADLEEGNDGLLRYIYTDEIGYFYPQGRTMTNQSWYSCIQNVIPRSSKQSEEALDFMYRLFEDPDLADILLAQPDKSAITRQDWYSEVGRQGRLYNPYLLDLDYLFPEGLIGEAALTNEATWQGFLPSAYGSDKLIDCLNYFDNPEAYELLQEVLICGEEAERAKKELFDELTEKGLLSLIDELRQDALAFLETEE